jgi:hypothetical protein
MRTLVIGLPLLVIAGLSCATNAWAGPQCAASLALHTLAAQASQWSAAIALEVSNCSRSKGRFALMTQAESMNGTVEVGERAQEWLFEGHQKGQFVYVIDQPPGAIITDAWIRGAECACLG